MRSTEAWVVTRHAQPGNYDDIITEVYLDEVEANKAVSIYNLARLEPEITEARLIEKKKGAAV